MRPPDGLIRSSAVLGLAVGLGDPGLAAGVLLVRSGHQGPLEEDHVL